MKKTNNQFKFQSAEFYHELDKLFAETNFNIMVLEPIMRHLLLIDRGTGYHTIEIVVKNHKVTVIKGADTQLVELPISLSTIKVII